MNIQIIFLFPCDTERVIVLPGGEQRWLIQTPTNPQGLKANGWTLKVNQLKLKLCDFRLTYCHNCRRLQFSYIKRRWQDKQKRNPHNFKPPSDYGSREGAKTLQCNHNQLTTKGDIMSNHSSFQCQRKESLSVASSKLQRRLANV